MTRNQSRDRRTMIRPLVGMLIFLLVGAPLEIVYADSSPATEASDETKKGDPPSVRDGHQDTSSVTDEADGEDKKIEKKEEEKWQPVTYIPPSRGRAEHTAGAGTRTFSQGDVTVAVIAPHDHIALTTHAQPTLYWYVSQDTSTRIDLTLVDDEAIDPLLEWTVPGPVSQGIHALDLSDRGLSLEPDKTYRWHVAVVQDSERRSNDTFDQGFIVRTSESKELEQRLDVTTDRYASYALSGIWYDAMHELLIALGDDPDNERLQLQRNALLDQAGLSEVVTYAVRAGR